MLRKFEFENSYSFRKCTLDLTVELNKDELDENGKPMPVPPEFHEAVRMREANSECGISPVAAIYGKNAGGKTNVLKALRDVANDVTGVSFSSRDKHSNFSSVYKEYNTRCFAPYTLKPKKNFELKYDICIALDEYVYTLEYAVFGDKIKDERVTKYKASKKNAPKVIYDKNDDATGNVYINDTLVALRKNDPEELWINSLKNLDADLKKLYDWFLFLRSGIKIDSTTNIDEANVFEEIARDIIVNENVKLRKRLERFLKHFDSSITHIEARESRELHQLLVFRKSPEEHTGNFARTNIMDESAATRKLIELFPLIDSVLEKGVTFVCDELDRALHPTVFNQLVYMFNSPKFNPNNAQLIFTAHNTIVLHPFVLRPDQIYIIDKSEYSESNVKRLSGVDPWSDMELDYRLGHYGSSHTDFHKNLDLMSRGESDEV